MSGAKHAEYKMNNPDKFIGWQPTCTCGKEPIPAVVLDCFSGAGTSAMVAQKLGRNYIGIELNQKYIDIAEKRIFNEIGLFI
jgi:hypothetical protein